MKTDRPDRTEYTSIVSPGRVQFESGVETGRERSGDSHLDLPQMLVRIGLAERVELRLEGAGGLAGGGAEHGPWMLRTPSLGTKVGLGEGGACRVRSALVARIGLPSLAVDGTAQPYSELAIVLEREFDNGIGLGGNAGLEWEDPGRAPVIAGSLSATFCINAELAFYAELYSAFPGTARADHRWGSGLTWAIGNDVQLDASGGKGFQGQGWFLGAGVSYRTGPW